MSLMSVVTTCQLLYMGCQLLLTTVVSYIGCQLQQTVCQLHQLHLEQPRDSKGENKLSHVPALLAF